MIKQILTVFDSKAKTYLDPIVCRNTEIAMRSLSELIDEADANHDFVKYTEDYSLFACGKYDDETGKMDTHSPTHICNLVELKNR